MNILNYWAIQSVSIFDNLGRLVLSKSVSSQQIEVNVAELSAGLYLVRAIGEQGSHTLSFLKK